MYPSPLGNFVILLDVYGRLLSGLSRGQPKRCYIRTTSSQYARMKNRRLKAASTLKRSCSGIREEGCKHSYGGVAQGSRIEEERPQAFFVLMEEWSGSREKIAGTLYVYKGVSGIQLKTESTRKDEYAGFRNRGPGNCCLINKQFQTHGWFHRWEFSWR